MQYCFWTLPLPQTCLRRARQGMRALVLCRFYALVWGAILVCASLLPTFRHFREQLSALILLVQSIARSSEKSQICPSRRITLQDDSHATVQSHGIDALKCCACSQGF